MNILLLGPQGSGKGTQARILCEKFNFFYFESGAYLRKMAESNPEIKKIMDEGGLVPDKEFTSYLTAYFDQQNLYDDIIFDGFPRTVDQYVFLRDWLSKKKVALDLVLVIKISNEEAIHRLSARRQDPETGKIYNLITDLPPDGIDVSKLVQRDDDKSEAIEKRLKIYREETGRLIDELRKETKVIEIDGERTIEAIAEDLEKIVRDFKNGN